MNINFFIVQSKDDKRNFNATFINSLDYSIDILWMNKLGEEVVEKTNLAQGEEYDKATFYNNFWVFKKSETEIRLTAEANEVKELVFEGGKFGVGVDTQIRVTIVESGNI